MSKLGKLDQALAELPQLDRLALCHRYQKLYGTQPPAKLSQSLLRLAIAYKLQEESLGKLKPATRRAMIAGQPPPIAVRGPGTMLVREWNGQHYSVSILDKGVSYQGQTYSSLSVVARLITGTPRSGPEFFGLKAKKP